MSNIEDTVRRVLDLAAAYRLAEHPQASLTELEAAIRAALSAGGGEAVAWQRQGASGLWIDLDSKHQMQEFKKAGHKVRALAEVQLGGD